MDQESIALGIEEGVTFEDCLITAYRDHCQAVKFFLKSVIIS